MRFQARRLVPPTIHVNVRALKNSQPQGSRRQLPPPRRGRKARRQFKSVPRRASLDPLNRRSSRSLGVSWSTASASGDRAGGERFPNSSTALKADLVAHASCASSAANCLVRALCSDHPGCPEVTGEVAAGRSAVPRLSQGRSVVVDSDPVGELGLDVRRAAVHLFEAGLSWPSTGRQCRWGTAGHVDAMATIALQASWKEGFEADG